MYASTPQNQCAFTACGTRHDAFLVAPKDVSQQQSLSRAHSTLGRSISFQAARPCRFCCAPLPPGSRAGAVCGEADCKQALKGACDVRHKCLHWYTQISFPSSTPSSTVTCGNALFLTRFPLIFYTTLFCAHGGTSPRSSAEYNSSSPD